MNGDSKNAIKEKSDNKESPYFGKRHIQVVLLFFLLTIGIGMRVQLAVAINAMTKNTSSNPDMPTYDWTNTGEILSSFYWGYLTLQLIAGLLGRVYGTKMFLIVAMLLNATGSLLIPLAAANIGSYGVCACRALQGIAQGFFYPSIYNLLGNWIPVDERAMLSTVALAGSSFGNIISNPLVGYICSTSLGWPFTFYMFAGFGYAWVIAWIIFGANSPAEHGGILLAERRYIESGSKENVRTESALSFKNLPFKAVATSLPVWALTIISVGTNWGGITLSTELPTYMNTVMKYDITSNGFLSTAPAISTFVSGFFLAPFADYLVKHKKLSVGATRKIFSGVGSLIPAVTLFVIGFLPNGANATTIVLLVLHGLFQGAVFGGFAVNHIDLSPKYVGIVIAITNTLSNAIGMLAPIYVQAMVTDNTDKSQWRIIFLTAASVHVASVAIFSIFGSGEIQPWNFDAADEKATRKNAVIDDKERKISRKVSLMTSL